MAATTVPCQFLPPILLVAYIVACGGSSVTDVSKLTGPSGHTVGGTVALTNAKRNLNCIVVVLSSGATFIEQINVGFRDGNTVCPIAGQIPQSGAQLPFAFTARLLPGLPYSVAVGAQPVDQCVVTRGNGVIGSTDIVNIVITCQ